MSKIPDTQKEFAEQLKKSLDNISMCHVPDDNWCPTCQSEWKIIKDTSSMFEKKQVEREKEIRSAS